MFNLETSMVYIWVVLFIVFLVAELATSVSLVSVWFCVGALAGLLASFAGMAPVGQFAVFIAVSVVMLYFTKPFVKKVLKVEHMPTNADKIIGAICQVVEAIDNKNSAGAIKFEGKIWSARNAAGDEVIEAGADIVVDRVIGVTAYVKQLQRSDV